MDTQITVKAPATTANLGPGFDCMGMALNLWKTGVDTIFSDDPRSISQKN